MRRMFGVAAVALLVAGCGGGTGEESASDNTASDSAAATGDGAGTGSADGGATPAPTGTQPSLGQTEPVDRATKEAETSDKKADFGDGISVTVESSKAVEMKSVLPGEIAGPAVAVTLAFKNDGDKDVSLANTIVSLNYDGQEASSFTGEPAANPPAKLAKGASGKGVFVFAVPKDKRQNVTIRVSYSPNAPQINFTGPVG